jgi:putative ABC transport system permease protein
MHLTWLHTWRTGFRTLTLHPLRSLLTVLGIFVGVASVIWLLAIGEGISRKAKEQIEGLGANNIIVRSVKPPSEANENIRGLVPYGITRDDFERLQETIPTIHRAVPIREHRRRFRHADQMFDGRLVGCTSEYAEMLRLQVDRGRFISDADGFNKENVCVLSAGTAERLFPFEDPLGTTIRIEEGRTESYYQIVGILKPRNPTAAIGGSLDAQDFSNDVYIPIDTFWSRLGDVIMTRRSGRFEGESLQLSQVTLRVASVADVVRTSKVVESMLAQFHPKKDYGVVVPLELLEQSRTTQILFMVFMGLIAAISLVVGGIGIMNIMLATVTERTVEIGIRRALGAKRHDIVRQFLVETVQLAIVGGVTGIVGGFACGPTIRVVRLSLERLFPNVVQNLPEVVRTAAPIVVPWSVPLAFAISIAVGIFFGLYPALRAARLDPIEALRHQ